MIPNVIATIPSIEVAPSKTWRVNLDTKAIEGGWIDGQAAVLQSVFLALSTPRFRHLIYSWQYGSELSSLIGKDNDYAFSEAKRMIIDALSNDSRITGLSNFIVTNGVLHFTLETIFGQSQINLEEVY